MSEQMTLEDKVQRLLDYVEIQNLMGKHMYYHAAGKHREEIEELWVKETPDPSWSNNNGVWVGIETIKQMYVERFERRCQIQLQKVIEKHPEIENKKENYGIGALPIRPLTTPVIEIAEDGKTAKGLWYSPGTVFDINDDGEQYTENKWEKYGVDFAKETDGWKIWHVQMCYDFSVPTEIWKEGVPSLACCSDIVPQRPPKFHYKEISLTTVPQIMPEIPQKYGAFSEVDAY
ncbi:nuclear transport factor 2 family protein [Chloroflexota bacterium]